MSWSLPPNDEWMDGAGLPVTPLMEQMGVTVHSAGHLGSRTHRVESRRRSDGLLMLVVNGAGHVRLGSWRDTVESGQLIYLPPGLAHGYAAHRRIGWELRWVHFAGHYALTLPGCIGFQLDRPVLSVRHCQRLQMHLVELLNLIKVVRGDVGLAAGRVLLDLLFDLRADQMDSQCLIEPLYGHIESSQVNLASIASEAGYSKYHYIRLFKQQTGMTPWQYLLSLKMQRACRQLTGTGLPIGQIAAGLGFGDANYFSRAFRRIIGLSPQSYRRQEGW